VPSDHGLAHADRVLGHARRTLVIDFGALDAQTCCMIELATLLHDADDRKLSPAADPCTFENARNILDKIAFPAPTLILKMISLVSTSSNGNTALPNKADFPIWMYIPRDSDRLEAIGGVGIIRCQQYAKRKGLPVSVPGLTPLICTEDELTNYLSVSSARFTTYQETGTSISEMDHYLDKLFWIEPAVKCSQYLTKLFKTKNKRMRKHFLHLSRQFVI
jgi:uncharacterized protein